MHDTNVGLDGVAKVAHDRGLAVVFYPPASKQLPFRASEWEYGWSYSFELYDPPIPFALAEGLL